MIFAILDFVTAGTLGVSGALLLGIGAACVADIARQRRRRS